VALFLYNRRKSTDRFHDRRLPSQQRILGQRKTARCFHWVIKSRDLRGVVINDLESNNVDSSRSQETALIHRGKIPLYPPFPKGEVAWGYPAAARQ
jgi:hypothetical protein